VLPNVPTVGETLPGFEVSTWSGVGAPRGTPGDVIATLNREINAALVDPGIKARLADVGGTPLVFTPAEFGAVIRADTEKWAKVIRSPASSRSDDAAPLLPSCGPPEGREVLRRPHAGHRR
jgi:tripartite-type tricarboxylate transporter receptor subunit TctC